PLRQSVERAHDGITSVVVHHEIRLARERAVMTRDIQLSIGYVHRPQYNELSEPRPRRRAVKINVQRRVFVEMDVAVDGENARIVSRWKRSPSRDFDVS